MKDTLITFAVLTTLTTTALAGGTGDPKLPKEVQPIQCLVGTWTSKNAVLTMEGKKHKADIVIACTSASAGFAVSCASKITVEGMGTVEETDLFGWDPHAGRYHWFAVTSMGETHDHVAMPPAGEKAPILFVYTGFQGTKPMQELLRMQFAGETKIELRNETTLSGQPFVSIVATLLKK